MGTPGSLAPQRGQRTQWDFLTVLPVLKRPRRGRRKQSRGWAFPKDGQHPELGPCGHRITAGKRLLVFPIASPAMRKMHGQWWNGFDGNYFLLRQGGDRSSQGRLLNWKSVNRWRAIKAFSAESLVSLAPSASFSTNLLMLLHWEGPSWVFLALTWQTCFLREGGKEWAFLSEGKASTSLMSGKSTPQISESMFWVNQWNQMLSQTVI